MTLLPKQKRIWITWEKHRRTRGLAQELNSELHELTTDATGIVRYLLLGKRTLFLLVSINPDILITQNPSIVLNALAILLRPFFNYKLVVDRHSNFKFSSENSSNPKWKAFHFLSQYVSRNSDLTIITNKYLRDVVSSWGGHGVILPDKLPDLPLARHRKLAGSKSFVFICSFDLDEPIKEVIDAARLLPSDHTLYVTGDSTKANPSSIQNIPENIILTGFLSEEDFQGLLCSVDIIIVLTKYEYTLTCGAYEAISLDKGMILSDTKTIRGYFSKGAIYTDPEKTSSIYNSMMEAASKSERLARELVDYKKIMVEDWKLAFSKLEEKIQRLS